ncbi:MAG: hypothetical protein ACLFSQ_12120, partial [Candidatus Zixiibacteriota bacterium]
NVWGTYLYQFLVGGLFFAIALIAIVKSGAADLSLKQDRKWFMWLVIGFILLALFFLGWTLLALST